MPTESQENTKLTRNSPKDRLKFGSNFGEENLKIIQQGHMLNPLRKGKTDCMKSWQGSRATEKD